MKHITLFLSVFFISLFSIAQVQIDSVITVNETCPGACDGTLTIYTSNGTPTEMYDIGGTPQTSNVFTGLCTTTYTVTVNDGLPSSDVTTAIVSSPTPLTYTVSTTNASAYGVCDGSANVTISGGTPPYLITYFDAGMTPLQSGTQTSITNLCAGTYNVDVTDANGCPATGPTGPSLTQFTITQPAPPTLVVNQNVYPISCSFFCDGSSDLIVSGGVPPYTYSWGTWILGNFCDGDVVPAWTVTDAIGQQVSGPSKMMYEDPPTLALIVNDESCSGVCDGDVNGTSISGANQPFTYALYDAIGNPLAGPQSTPLFSNLCPGSYNLVQTSSVGCNTGYSFTILAATPLVVTVNTITNASCSGSCDGDATLNVTGGQPPYTYFWNTVPVCNTPNLGSCGPICAGTYSCTITDANGCTTISTAQINEPSILNATATFVSDPTAIGACDGSASGTGIGGTTPYTYLWIGCPPTISPNITTPTTNGLCDGNYQIIITDINGCVDTSNCITITDPPTGIITRNNNEFINTIYPNPTNGIITIDFKENVIFPLTIEIIDITGSKVKEYTLKDKSSTTINISFLTKGIYLLNNNQLGIQKTILLK
jgi:hypothetical protein